MGMLVPPNCPVDGSSPSMDGADHFDKHSWPTHVQARRAGGPPPLPWRRVATRSSIVAAGHSQHSWGDPRGGCQMWHDPPPPEGRVPARQLTPNTMPPSLAGLLWYPLPCLTLGACGRRRRHHRRSVRAGASMAASKGESWWRPPPPHTRPCRRSASPGGGAAAASRRPSRCRTGRTTGRSSCGTSRPPRQGGSTRWCPARSQMRLSRAARSRVSPCRQVTGAPLPRLHCCWGWVQRGKGGGHDIPPPTLCFTHSSPCCCSSTGSCCPSTRPTPWPPTPNPLLTHPCAPCSRAHPALARAAVRTGGDWRVGLGPGEDHHRDQRADHPPLELRPPSGYPGGCTSMLLHLWVHLSVVPAWSLVGAPVGRTCMEPAAGPRPGPSLPTCPR